MQDATWITELDDATQFVIWSYRRWVSGPDHWTLVRREYDGRFGAEAGRATLADFARLIEALCAGAHRRLEYHTACCPCVCHDELRLAALVGAAQMGDGDDVADHARDLVGQAAIPLLASRARAYAAALNRRGLAIRAGEATRVLH